MKTNVTLFKQLVSTALLMTSTLVVYGQYSKSDMTQYENYISEISDAPPIMEMNLSFVASPEQADISYNPMLKAPKTHNRSKDYSKLLEIKEKGLMEKMSYKVTDIGDDFDQSEREVSFNVTQGYYADLDGGCPNDNTIAVGNDGKVISMMNGSVGVYSPSGTKINVFSLESFFNFNASSPCDPKVEYDQGSDRYFMFVQSCGQNPDNVVMGFSQTNDPNGSWWAYVFPTDALGDGSMSDYPKVAITRDEVFVSLNLFSDGGQGQFSQSIVYQMDKYDGYNGDNLTYRIWEGFPSTTLIVRSGTNQYGPGAYTINNASNGADWIVLTDITRNLGDPDAQLIQYQIPVDAYQPPAPAFQPGTDTNLDTGDCRVQDGYYQNGIIHFVFSVSDEQWGAIRYYRLDPSTNSVDYKTITARGEKDYSYPSISPYTTDATDQTSIIHFGAASGNTFPEIRAKVYQDDFSTSASGFVFGGNAGVHSSQCFDSGRGVARWGDYSGIAYKYNENRPTVYVAGSVAGAGSNMWWTHISRLEAMGFSTSTTEVEERNVSTFPIPAVDYLTVLIDSDKTTQATFSLYNEVGVHISNLLTGVMHTGENRFTFDTSSLSTGAYFLTITNDNNEIIKTEKIVVAH